MSIQVTGTPAAGVDELASVLGVDPGTEADPDPEVVRAWESAVSEIDYQLARQFRPIEAHLLDALRLEVAQEYYSRTDRAASGSQYVEMDGGTGAVRGPRDPLNRSYPILDRYRVSL